MEVWCEWIRIIIDLGMWTCGLYLLDCLGKWLSFEVGSMSLVISLGIYSSFPPPVWFLCSVPVDKDVIHSLLILSPCLQLAAKGPYQDGQLFSSTISSKWTLPLPPQKKQTKLYIMIFYHSNSKVNNIKVGTRLGVVDVNNQPGCFIGGIWKILNFGLGKHLNAVTKF